MDNQDNLTSQFKQLQSHQTKALSKFYGIKDPKWDNEGEDTIDLLTTTPESLSVGYAYFGLIPYRMFVGSTTPVKVRLKLPLTEQLFNIMRLLPSTASLHLVRSDNKVAYELSTCWLEMYGHTLTLEDGQLFHENVPVTCLLKSDTPFELENYTLIWAPILHLVSSHLPHISRFVTHAPSVSQDYLPVSSTHFSPILLIPTE